MNPPVPERIVDDTMAGIGGYKRIEVLQQGMQATESVKVPDGKLVRVAVTFNESIDNVEITGDFFLEPPEALADLETAIEGHSASVSAETLEEAIASVDAELIGFDAFDLAAVTVEAMQ